MIIRYKDKEIVQLVEYEYNFPFSGWDFAHIDDRFVNSNLPWSYSSEIIKRLRLKNIKSFLDMGTGGGEFISQHFQPFPLNSYATEAYIPNINVAKSRLEPLGVKVIAIGEDGILPFEDNYFDLIINQHEFYDSKEVFRVLKPGGEFITKQVHQDNDKELAELLGFKFSFVGEWTLSFAVQQLKNSGFNINEQMESDMELRIFDVGAIAYYLKICPWAIPEFDITSHKERFIPIQRKIEEKGYISLNTPRFMVFAQKPI